VVRVEPQGSGKFVERGGRRAAIGAGGGRVAAARLLFRLGGITFWRGLDKEHVMDQSELSARERFEALFEGHHAEVAAYVRRRASAAVVEDVVSDTFLVAWRSLDRLHGDPLPWLYGVARRVLANDVRGERRRAVLTERLAREREGQDAGVSIEVSEPLRAALLTLGEREREALLLIAWEGLTPAQAAAVVGCSSATFRGRLYRARRQIARTVGSGRSADGLLEMAAQVGRA
jgi:RNA polymerase sigma-70 factor (ECF subfamily)